MQKGKSTTEITINPLLPKKPVYEISRQKYREMYDIKKTAQRYDSNGQKKFKIQDGKMKYNRQKIKVLKHERMDGPFSIMLYVTGSESSSKIAYVYRGCIDIPEGEYAYVYRDSLEDGYIDAKFCDDTVLLMEVKNKQEHTTRFVKIDGEPTWTKMWDFSETDYENHTNQNIIEKMVKKKAEESGISEENIYAVIQLDC